MTEIDTKNIFNVNDENIIILPNKSKTTLKNFLNIAGFKNAPDNPTKQELLEYDNGVKGYKELIENGNYE